MPTITGASRKEAGLFYDKGGAVFNVMHPDFGAVGDGVTNDAAAIQLAIDACAAFSPFTGGKVFFPHPPASYFIGTTTLNIPNHGVLLEAADRATYLKYSGTGYAISFSIAGANQQHRCGIINLGVLCTATAGSCVYSKSGYGFVIRESYFENTASLTGIAVTIDSGNTSLGTGISAEQCLVSHIRSNGFLKGVLFKGGSLSGADCAVACSVEHSLINSQVGLAGSIGIEFQNSQQCSVIGGDLEVLDYGVVLTNTPGNCIGISLIDVRTELIGVNSWLIPAACTDCVVISPRVDVDKSSDLAVDTVVVATGGSGIAGRTMAMRRNKKAIVLANGVNNNVNIGNYGYIEITGPTGAFSITGFTGGSAGRELDVIYYGAQAMTIAAGNAGSSSANQITTLSTDGGADVVCGTPFGAACRFIWNTVRGQWVLVSKR